MQNSHSLNHLSVHLRFLRTTFNWSKCFNPRPPQPLYLRQTKGVAPTPVGDSDEQGEEDSSPSSSSDSSDSSDEECATPITSSIMVMNAKSHVVHAVRHTNSECSKKFSFSSEGKTFEGLCGPAVLDAPIQMMAEIPQGAKIYQRKACLASIDHFLK